jgi:DNA (cytosine-5)-methyltransferase 1
MNGLASHDKPPYRVPSMAEVAALPWNGFTVVSLFSGCGGSCLGFKMAGYKILWANEFIPAAQETYRLNSPETVLCTDDVRTVQPKQILEVIGKQRGEVDVLEGSPPCASFSTAGKREKNWGKVKQYSDTRQRVDDLFFEYARLLDGLQPKVFVAENVSGLVKGTAKGYFKEILTALKACGYQVQAKLLDAQWLGVPQMRQRIIFVGVRNDIGMQPMFPKPLPYRYSVREALPWIVKHEYMGPGHTVQFASADTPAYTVSQMGNFSKKESAYTWVEALPVDGTGAWQLVTATNERHTLAGSPHPRQAADVAPTITATVPGMSMYRAYRDRRGAFGNDGDCTEQPAPTVLADSVGTHWIEPETDISRFAIGKLWDEIGPGEQHPKRFSLVKPALDAPCNTVDTAGRGDYSPSGQLSRATIVHPVEKRKFSIAELKRICAFPDDFQLTGTYAQQWERLGRAVPPVMMRHIAAAIREGILVPLSQAQIEGSSGRHPCFPGDSTSDSPARDAE